MKEKKQDTEPCHLKDHITGPLHGLAPPPEMPRFPIPCPRQLQMQSDGKLCSKRLPSRL